MPKKKQICRNCLYYNAYYTKGIVKFNKKSYGDCGKLKSQVKSEEGCNLWEDNSALKIKRQKEAKDCILFSLEHIGEIINLIKTDYDDET